MWWALPFSPVLVSSDVSSVLRSRAVFSPIQWSLPCVLAILLGCPRLLLDSLSRWDLLLSFAVGSFSSLGV